VTHWGERYDALYFLSASVAYCSDYVLAARPSDNAVVDNYDPLALYVGFYCDDFLDNFCAALICGLNEASKFPLLSVPSLHQALFHRDATLLRVAERGRPGRVWDRDDNVCVERILASEDSAELSTRFVDVMALDGGAGVGEVGVLKWTVIVTRRLCKSGHCNTVLVETDQFTRLYVSDEICVKCCKRAALTGEDVGLVFFVVSEAEGPESCLVTCRQYLTLLGQDHEAERPTQFLGESVECAGPIVLSTMVLE